ncbi:hypothetical protein LCGC14_2031750 [marine sediment metagenome]|uniref:Uncharacterized protein n=1 Tax=marine sediment metagenome TaxID=412755 RepID=A0A0F9EUL1_9ZZZZ
MLEFLAQTTQVAGGGGVNVGIEVLRGCMVLAAALVGAWVGAAGGLRKERKLRQEEREVVLPGRLLGAVEACNMLMTGEMRAKAGVMYWEAYAERCVDERIKFLEVPASPKAGASADYWGRREAHARQNRDVFERYHVDLTVRVAEAFRELVGVLGEMRGCYRNREQARGAVENALTAVRAFDGGEFDYEFPREADMDQLSRWLERTQRAAAAFVEARLCGAVEHASNVVRGLGV